MQPAFSSCQFGNALTLVQRKSFLQLIDRVHKIIAARCKAPREDRIGGVGSVKYPDAVFFDGNVGI